MHRLWFFLLAGFQGLLATSSTVALFYPDIKIDPLTGKAVGVPQSSYEALDRWNLLKQSSRLSFVLLEDETLRLQLAVRRDSYRQINIQSNSSLSLRLYQLGMVRLTRPSPRYFPDILIPLPIDSRSGKVLPFHHPDWLPEDRLLDIFWMEVSNTPSTGPSQIQIIVHLVDGSRQSVTLTLSSLKASLPDPPLLIDFNEYGDKYLNALLPNRSSREAVLETDLQVFRFFRRHGGVLNPLPYKSQRGTARAGMTPVLLNDDLLQPRLDWEFYDQRFGRYFDGSAFPDGRPLHHFYLPFNPNWPAPFEWYFEDRERYEKIWAAFARAFQTHFQEKGWTNTIFQIYCNQKPNPNNRIPWNLDEPKGVDDYRALRYFAELTHRVFQHASAVKFKFRIDIAHFFCNKHRGNPQKDFRVNHGFHILEPVDIWVISIHSLSGITARTKAGELRERGREVWVYGNTPPVEEEASAAYWRIYQTYINGWNGFLVWKTFTYGQEVEKSKDYISYILPVQGTPRLLPSLRLKFLKQAQEDLQVLEWLIGVQRMERDAVRNYLKALKAADYPAWWEFRRHLAQFKTRALTDPDLR